MNHSLKLLSSALLTSALLATSALAFPYQDPAASAKTLSAPQLTEMVAPALTANESGQNIRVRLTIDENGQTSEVRVLSSVDRALNRRIVKAVEQWRFEPARRNGQPVKVRAVMPIELRLDAAS